MQITEIPTEGYERVVRADDPESGLCAIISVHDTTLGPALGGLRMWPYPSFDDALTDVLRLSRGMTFKSAIAHTGLGGGKSVIVGDPATTKSEALYLAMGRFIDSLDGKYITAEDVNTKMADLEIVSRETRFVTGLSQDSGSSGNPSPYTARGCFHGIKACVERRLGSDDLTGVTVAMLGLGAVGSALARDLADAGAVIYGNDMREERMQGLADEIGLIPASSDEIMTMEADVLAPCALGGLLNDETIPKLHCKIVAGCANNQLLERRHGGMLRERGILYAPDYVINAGGIINVACELLPGGYDEQTSLQRIRRIPDALHEVFDLSDERGMPTAEAAYELAQQILAQGRAEPAGA